MDKKNKTIEARIIKDKNAILEQLRKMPIIQITCERSGVSRATYYRWRNEDAQFKKAADVAARDGELLINDMSESQIIALIKDRHWSAISFWLKHHHPKYATKVEIDIKEAPAEKLTPEQEAAVKSALRCASLNYEYEEKKP